MHQADLIRQPKSLFNFGVIGWHYDKIDLLRVNLTEIARSQDNEASEVAATGLVTL